MEETILVATCSIAAIGTDADVQSTAEWQCHGQDTNSLRPHRRKALPRYSLGQSRDPGHKKTRMMRSLYSCAQALNCSAETAAGEISHAEDVKLRTGTFKVPGEQLESCHWRTHHVWRKYHHTDRRPWVEGKYAAREPKHHVAAPANVYAHLSHGSASRKTWFVLSFEDKAKSSVQAVRSIYIVPQSRKCNPSRHFLVGIYPIPARDRWNTPGASRDPSRSYFAGYMGPWGKFAGEIWRSGSACRFVNVNKLSQLHRIRDS